ncbi:hypothetical protein N7475_002306 [Penicillium sp. IBT 31633x]|nr:hypothetical protein N7475_002306 [Penicillium sp. IBT 31633x]
MYAIFPNEYHHNDQPEQLSHILPKRMLNYTTNGPDRKEEASAKTKSKPDTKASQTRKTPAMTITRHDPPHCRKCHHEGIKRIVRDENPNGNAGRPYYQCSICGRFICFDDTRGISPANPRCDCGKYARRQISGVSKRVRHGIHYICARGGCGFYEEDLDADGVQRQVPDRSVGTCARYSYI